MRYERSQPPASDAVTLSDVKDYLRLTHTEDDHSLSQLITVATSYFEQTYNMALIRQRVTIWLDHWPIGRQSAWWSGQQSGAVADILGGQRQFILPIRPALDLIEVAMITREDHKNMVPLTDFRLSGSLEPRLILKDGMNWPSVERESDGMSIEYDAGFGDDHTAIPLLIQYGLLEMIAHLYTHRGDDLDRSAQSCGARTLWQPYRKVQL